jgi:hypothetical protein
VRQCRSSAKPRIRPPPGRLRFPEAILTTINLAVQAETDPTAMVQPVSNAPAIVQMSTANLSTPFNFIATTTVEIAAGTPVPMEQVTISITETISAQP